MEDLIPPTVVIVGGFSSRTSTEAKMLDSSIAIAQGYPLHESQNNRHSFLSSMSVSSLHSSLRDNHSLSSSMTSPSRRGSSPSLHDHEHSFAARAAESIKADRIKAKQDIKDARAAIKALDKSDRILGRLPREEQDLSFSDMLAANPIASTSSETLRADKATLKAHAKALKAEERARKESIKLEKQRAAVQARNDKIDAHDRAVRARQVQKEALRQVKEQAQSKEWRAQAKSASEHIWQPRDSHVLLAKTRALQV